jgi:hypothetical protein
MAAFTVVRGIMASSEDAGASCGPARRRETLSMPGRPIDNERKACDAVVRALERLSGSSRTDAYSPEDIGAAAPVEYAFELGGTRHAVEHTIVEAFAGQIHTAVDFETFIEPIAAALDHRMQPPGRFDLHFAIHPTKGMKPREVAAARQGIIAWVRTKAAELHNECPEQPPRNYKPGGFRNFRKETIADVELTLSRETIWSQPSIAHGRLFITRFAPKDYEALRADRMRTAMEKKLPKLKAWKDGGARSVLVLENGDLSLSNHWVIAGAIEAALRERSDKPDEVWLVDTAIRAEWTVICLIRDDVVLPDDETEKRYWQFDPAVLEAV